MRKTFAALALATLTFFAVPTAANAADEQYPPTTPPTTTTVVCGVNPSAANAGGSACATRPVVSGRSASLAATGMNDAVLPIAAGGGLLAVLGAGLLVARRRPVRD